MRTKTKLVAPQEVEPRAEHPHRCTAGHRWQHDGPSATTCGLPTYDQISGDLPFVGHEDCPVCCGRSDLLVRERHSHYCNMCDGDWQHEGHCLDSLAACCPWCFPKPDAEPMPGARSGPHFHVCSECGQNWRHATGCAVPLRAALPECPGCQSPRPPAESDAQARAPALTTPSAGARALGNRIRPLARPIGIAAVALLSIPIVLKGYSALRSPVADGSAPVIEERIEAPSPAPAPSAPAPPEPAPDLAKSPADSSPAKQTPPSDVVSPPPAPRPPVKEVRRGRASDRVAERAQEPRPQILRPQERDVIPEPATRPPVPDSSAAESLPASLSKPAPAVARSETIVETPGPASAAPPAPTDSGPPAPVRAARPSIPGAPPFGALSGSSGLDTSLDGHPRRVAR
jgi:hypothetical protein